MPASSGNRDKVLKRKDKMEIIRNYEEMLETTYYIPHHIEAILDRLVKKGIITEDASINFIRELR